MNTPEKGASSCSRRNFLKLAGIGGAVALSDLAHASEQTASPGKGAKGVLVDTTLCVGCRQCEEACNSANRLPKPDKAFDDESALDEIRKTTPTAYTVVNRYNVDKVSVTRKQQCMHCVEPACSSACIIYAMEKQPNGAVTYRDDLCLGCRYCMVSCPFDMPKFEYSKAAPLIKKCQFCFDRQLEGLQPACVEACPMEALKFGNRLELIDEAKSRIYTQPNNYIHHVYGEHEAGGTSWLYLANVPFEKLGLPMLNSKPYPEMTAGAMSTVPMIMLLWPVLLMGFHHFTSGNDNAHGGHSNSRHVR